MESQVIFSFIAGSLTTLSPCVLPILPLVLGSASKRHRLSPLLMTLGLSTTFLLIGWTVAAFGSFLGLEGSTLRSIAGIALVVSGLVALVPKAQAVISEWLSPLVNIADSMAGKVATSSFKKQQELLASYFTGLLFGIIWSPCSGPTLGATVALAASAGGGWRAGWLMFIFSLGAGVPLLVIAYGARAYLQRNKVSVVNSAGFVKKVFACAMILIGFAIVFGFDKAVESFFVEHMPDVWVDLTTKY